MKGSFNILDVEGTRTISLKIAFVYALLNFGTFYKFSVTDRLFELNCD